MSRALPPLVRWHRSLFRRLAGAVNAGGELMLQGAPLALARQGIDLRALRRHWIAGNPKGNDLDLARLAFLALNITALEREHVPGAFAEVGVWRGNAAKAIHALAPTRRFYLFDTFEGFDAADGGTSRSIMVHFRDTSAAQVREFINSAADVRIVSGRFPETVGAVPEEERFAFVQIDCDLYAPTLAALGFFYPRMAPRGLMVVHDYASGRWPGVAQAVDEFLADKPEALLYVPDVSGSVAFRRAPPPPAS
jgi:O-methyltransferase